jgi:flagella basal body P-ring formation protein FlgA
MLCRTFQTVPKPARSALALLAVLLGGVVSLTQAQNTPAVATAWPALESGAKQFVVDSLKVDPTLVSILPMDSRINIKACSQDIVFDQPYGNKQSVRARCAQPVWQHFVMVQVKTGIGAQFTNATQTNAVTKLVWVSTQSIKRGTTVQPGMFKNTEISVPVHETRFVSDERELVNTELLRDLPANTPVKMQDLKPTAMVRRGQQVTVAVGGEGKG